MAVGLDDRGALVLGESRERVRHASRRVRRAEVPRALANCSSVVIEAPSPYARL